MWLFSSKFVLNKLIVFKQQYRIRSTRVSEQFQTNSYLSLDDFFPRNRTYQFVTRKTPKGISKCMRELEVDIQNNQSKFINTEYLLISN